MIFFSVQNLIFDLVRGMGVGGKENRTTHKETICSQAPLDRLNAFWCPFRYIKMQKIVFLVSENNLLLFLIYKRFMDSVPLWYSI